MLQADRLNSVRLISLVCSVIFCIGNLMYANIALVPNKIGSISDARVWYMLLVRFVVGIGTGKFLFAVKDDFDDLR